MKSKEGLEGKYGQVGREAERHGFAWAYWEMASGFGAYDPVAHQWREDLLKALIP